MSAATAASGACPGRGAHRHLHGRSRSHGRGAEGDPGRAPMTPALAAHLRYVEGITSFQRGIRPRRHRSMPALRARPWSRRPIDHAFRAEAGLVAAHSQPGGSRGRLHPRRARLAQPRARPGWPRAIGHSLANFARQLHSAGEYQRAMELFLEAREVLSPHTPSRASSPLRATTSATRSSRSGATRKRS